MMLMGLRMPVSIQALIILALLCFSSLSTAQDQTTTPSPDELASEVSRLDRVVDALDKKRVARENLKQSLVGIATPSSEDQRELDQLNEDIQSLTETFEILTVGDMDEALFKAVESEPFDWQTELMLVLEPVLDGLQSLTEKPRQMTNLRALIALNKRRLQAAEKAIEKLGALPASSYEEDTQLQIGVLLDKWINQKESIEQRLIGVEAQLERLEAAEENDASGVLPSLKEFILGRGLTLLLAILAVLVTWVLMRFIWWVFSSHIVSKDQRRGSLWFRLLSYSFYLVNIIVSIVAVLVVLYLREDLLLLALALLALAVMALGIRRYIPSYVREARLLLDLGAVREGERVMYNDLPWQVTSINLNTVLWNPNLDGVVRLPLETIETLTSRPIKDKNWFPTRKGDYVLLPDGTFGLVLSQTPELIELRVKGGMIQWIRTADWYSMSIINLSIGKTYGVSVTFGLDYGLQAISLTEIPKTLEQGIVKALNNAGYEKYVEGLLVELKSAGASSIDYLIFVTVSSEKASDYYSIERLVQQTCVAVANEQGWNIPFPQMVVHHQPA